MGVPITVEVLGTKVEAEVPLEDILPDIVAALPFVTEEQAQQQDFHYYAAGENYLTIDQGARKATKYIMESIFAKAGQDNELDSYLTVYNATLAAMSQGVDRGFFYRLAGGIAAGNRDEGQYVGIPLAVVYAYKLRKILADS